MENRITKILGVEYPIIQGGMVWCSGWRLASAVSNAGGVGLLGSGSMSPQLLSEHIEKCRAATSRPFGVNLPLMRPDTSSMIDTIIEHGIKIVFTSAGNPQTWTKRLKEHGITVVHVVASSLFALKAQDAGVDAVVAEGFEAGGHNGREETSTMVLIPKVVEAISIPVIAAGGIATPGQLAAALCLGAEGVQVGSRFAISVESSAHDNFKRLCIGLKEGDTMLSLKKLTPVRLVKNNFFEQVTSAEANGASAEELLRLIGVGRTKQGMFEGNISDGELEIGQASCLLHEIESVERIMTDLKSVWVK